MTTNPPEQDMDIHSTREADYIRFKHYAALTFLIASPVLIALPPRKLDHLTVLLAGAFCVSANHLTRERTGRSIVERIEARITSTPSLVMSDLPSQRAQEIQAKLRAARDAQIREGSLVGEELERLKARREQERGVAERIWSGWGDGGVEGTATEGGAEGVGGGQGVWGFDQGAYLGCVDVGAEGWGEGGGGGEEEGVIMQWWWWFHG